MLDAIALEGLKLLPKNLVSRAMGAFSEIRWPGPIQVLVNRISASLLDIDADEARREIDEYRSLNALFTRHLREETRPIRAERPGHLTSPVDGRLAEFGEIDDGRMIQAKGRRYRLSELVDDGRLAGRFEGGKYATLYLSPSDYHRIHAPIDGRVTSVHHIPGHLFPVNPFAVKRVDRLFAINERLISVMETAVGPVGVVKVGATCVGRITLTPDGLPSIQTNQPRQSRRRWDIDDEVELAAGDELGVFNLGSTVILLLGDDSFRFEPALERGDSLRFGERLGEWPER
jgi:phosphatidylserine decarboxylase